MWLEIALLVVLTLVNGGLSGSEMAVVSLRESQLARLVERGDRGRKLGALAGDQSRFLATIQVGITLAGFLASAVATSAFAGPVEEQLGFLGGAAPAVAVIVVVLAVTYTSLVIGELAPKRLAQQRSEGWALLSAAPVTWLARATRPAVWFLGKSVDGLVRLLGFDPRGGREEMTEEELRDILASQETFTDEQRQILDSAIEVAERRLGEIFKPRPDVVSVDADADVGVALRRLLSAGHSRAPVMGGALDEVLGVVHVRDLIDAAGSAGARARPVPILPESLPVLDALRQMRASRQHLAIVRDEYGSFAGIVTMEDLLEEIVGEIYDETDRDVAGAVRSGDGSLELPGTFPVHDLGDVGVHLPEGEYRTIAGLVLAELDDMPEGPGAAVEVDGWRVEVLEMAGRAITKVRLAPLPGGDGEVPGADGHADGDGDGLPRP